MADKSKIEWTDATWNPIRGCSVVSEGCRNCYAMAVAARFSDKGMAYEGLAYRNQSGPHWTGQVKMIEDHLEDPLRWKRPRRIFLNSMSDLFHESIPDDWIDQIFAIMALAHQHIFQILTKRPQRMRQYLLGAGRQDNVCRWLNDLTIVLPQHLQRIRSSLYEGRGHRNLEQWPLPNAWLGVSCEDQKTADERIPQLLQTPAAVRWVSAEPLLGPIDLESHPRHWLTLTDSLLSCSSKISDPQARLDWVIVGGESGPSARPMHPDWAHSLRDQCVAAGVPFFFKQWGKYLPVGPVKSGDEVINGTAVFDQDGERLLPDCCGNDYDVDESQVAIRFGPVGKKAAGRILDGREWNEYPDIALGGA